MSDKLGSAFALVLLLPIPLSAQDLDEVCSSVGRLDTGSYVTYGLTGATQGTRKIEEMRFAVVGEKTVNGTPLFWYEFRALADEPLVVQMLVPSFPFEAETVREVVYKAGDQPAMKVPSQMLPLLRSQVARNPLSDLGRLCAQSEVLGRETVSVPAGSFTTLHIRPATGLGEAWISPDIPFGVVQAHTDDGQGMVLTDFGRDAVSSITETPRPMPLPGLGQQ